MSIMARYSGICPECGGRWQPGDMIHATYTDEYGTSAWQHASCPDDPGVSLRRGESVCPSCWLTSCDCEDDRA